MLDVHPPHSPTHSWIDFFIHVGTICVGLLIAVGLEQTVELFHHRYQAHRAQEMILAEIDFNRTRISQQLQLFESHESALMKDLAVLRRIRRHTLQPTDQLEYLRLSDRLSDSAWSAARTSGVVDYLPQDEVVAWESIYKSQAAIDAYSVIAKDDLVKATAVLNSADGPQHLTGAQFRAAEMTLASSPSANSSILQNLQPADLLRLAPTQIDELEHGFQVALSQDDQMIRWYVDLDASMDKALSTSKP